MVNEGNQVRVKKREKEEQLPMKQRGENLWQVRKGPLEPKEMDENFSFL